MVLVCTRSTRLWIANPLSTLSLVNNVSPAGIISKFSFEFSWSKFEPRRALERKWPRIKSLICWNHYKLVAKQLYFKHFTDSSQYRNSIIYTIGTKRRFLCLIRQTKKTEQVEDIRRARFSEDTILLQDCQPALWGQINPIREANRTSFLWNFNKTNSLAFSDLSTFRCGLSPNVRGRAVLERSLANARLRQQLHSSWNTWNLL